jgi:nitronate monooxygenase
MARRGLNLWHFRGHALLPVVQGGMGVGVSAGGLAGTVASFDGVGTISSVDLRRAASRPDGAHRHLEGPTPRR